MAAISNATITLDVGGDRRLAYCNVPGGYAANDTLVIPGISVIDAIVGLTVVSSSTPVSVSTSTPMFASGVGAGNTVTLSAGTSVALGLNFMVVGH